MTLSVSLVNPDVSLINNGTGLLVFPNFNAREPAVDTRWRKWCARQENLLVGLDIKDDKRNRALLLHYAGEEVNEIFDTLQDTGDDYATALDKLNGYFAPKKPLV